MTVRSFIEIPSVNAFGEFAIERFPILVIRKNKRLPNEPVFTCALKTNFPILKIDNRFEQQRNRFICNLCTHDSAYLFQQIGVKTILTRHQTLYDSENICTLRQNLRIFVGIEGFRAFLFEKVIAVTSSFQKMKTAQNLY